MPSIRRKVLLVDDNRDALEATSALLAYEGFSVVAARDGRDALDKMHQDAGIAVVLLDLWMPGMDGWEFLLQKKSDPSIAEVPVIVISGVAPRFVEGAEAVLRKPINVESLLMALKRHVSGTSSSGDSSSSVSGEGP